jgi:hypothetical protein
MPAVTVTDEATTIVDGTQSVDTIVKVGARPVRMAFGDPEGRSFGDAMPFGIGQFLTVPAGLEVTGWTRSGVATVWTEEFTGEII